MRDKSAITSDSSQMPTKPFIRQNTNSINKEEAMKNSATNDEWIAGASFIPNDSTSTSCLKNNGVTTEAKDAPIAQTILKNKARGYLTECCQ